MSNQDGNDRKRLMHDRSPIPARPACFEEFEHGGVMRTQAIKLDPPDVGVEPRCSDPSEFGFAPTLPKGTSITREGNAIRLTFPLWPFTYTVSEAGARGVVLQPGGSDAWILAFWRHMIRILLDESGIHDDEADRDLTPSTQAAVIYHVVPSQSPIPDRYCPWPMIHALVQHGLMAYADPKRMTYVSTWREVAKAEQERVEVRLDRAPVFADAAQTDEVDEG